MGTDIHSVGQVRKDGKWKTVVARPGGDSRCYDTFAVLADVRNGSGFAGCDTGESWPVMFQPRGFPDDFEVKDCCTPLEEPYYWPFDKDKIEPEYDLFMGDHTWSWLSLSELHKIRDQFAGKDYEIHGMISEQQYKDLEQGKLPETWCGWTNQPDHVHAKWKVPAQKCLHTLNDMIQALDEVRKSHEVSADDVRVVFGFDS